MGEIACCDQFLNSKWSVTWIANWVVHGSAEQKAWVDYNLQSLYKIY